MLSHDDMHTMENSEERLCEIKLSCWRLQNNITAWVELRPFGREKSVLSIPLCYVIICKNHSQQLGACYQLTPVLTITLLNTPSNNLIVITKTKKLF